MKSFKYPLVAACALVVAGQVSFAQGPGAGAANSTTSPINSDRSTTTDTTTTTRSTTGSSTGASSDTMSGTSSGSTMSGDQGTASDTSTGTATTGTTGTTGKTGTTGTTGTGTTGMGTTGTTGTGSTMGTAGTGTTGTSGSMAGTSGNMMMMKKGQNYQVINFTAKGTELTEANKKQLRTLIDSAKAKGEIDQVHVAVWSNKNFPKEGQELTDAEKSLAEQRISSIDKYFTDTLKLDNVETYSMAERTNWFARAFNTNEAELQSLFSQQGAPMNIDPKGFKAVKKEGGPNKAVIMIEMKNEGTTSGASSNTHSNTSSGSTFGRGDSMSDDMNRAPASSGTDPLSDPTRSVDGTESNMMGTSPGSDSNMGTGSGTSTDSQ